MTRPTTPERARSSARISFLRGSTEADAVAYVASDLQLDGVPPHIADRHARRAVKAVYEWPAP